MLIYIFGFDFKGLDIILKCRGAHNQKSNLIEGQRWMLHYINI